VVAINYRGAGRLAGLKRSHAADRLGRPCRGGQHPRASGAAATVTAPRLWSPAGV